MHFRTIIILLLLVHACSPVPTREVPKRYPPGVDPIRNAMHRNDSSPIVFADEGASFGLTLNTQGKPGFSGPYIRQRDGNTWNSEDMRIMGNFRIEVNGTERTDAFEIEQFAEPGLLVQHLISSELHFELHAYFHDRHTLVIDLIAQHLNSGKLPVDFHWNRTAVDGFLIRFPDGYFSDDGEQKPQRINFLSFEQRHLRWMITQAPSAGSKTIPAAEPAQPYLNNCARWFNRNEALARSSAPDWTAACMQVLISRAGNTKHFIDSLAIAQFAPELATEIHVDPASREPTDLTLIETEVLTAVIENRKPDVYLPEHPMMAAPIFIMCTLETTGRR